MKIDKFEQVKSVINDFDPIHLMDFAPEDEYDSEIKLIINTVNFNSSVESIQDELYKIFVESFDSDSAGDKSQYLKVAKKLKEIELS